LIDLSRRSESISWHCSRITGNSEVSPIAPVRGYLRLNKAASYAFTRSQGQTDKSAIQASRKQIRPAVLAGLSLNQRLSLVTAAAAPTGSPCRRVPHVRVLDSAVKVVKPIPSESDRVRFKGPTPARLLRWSALPGSDETLVDEFTVRD
jgi:hypothetical protein